MSSVENRSCRAHLAFLAWALTCSSEAVADSFGSLLVAAAMERTTYPVEYDGSYYSIPYPGGDVPADKGVCTDVIVRSYRQLVEVCPHVLVNRFLQVYAKLPV